MLTFFQIIELSGQREDIQTKMCYVDLIFYLNITEGSTDKTKDIIGYVISLMKLKVKDLIFLTKTL